MKSQDSLVDSLRKLAKFLDTAEGWNELQMAIGSRREDGTITFVVRVRDLQSITFSYRSSVNRERQEYTEQTEEGWLTRYADLHRILWMREGGMSWDRAELLERTSVEIAQEALDLSRRQK